MFDKSPEPNPLFNMADKLLCWYKDTQEKKIMNGGKIHVTHKKKKFDIKYVR